MKKQKLNKLKIIRLIIGIVTLILLTAFFVDISGILPHRLHILAHLQFIPAILLAIANTPIYLIILIILVLLFGRLYCSILCPLGVFQDTTNWIAKRIIKKKQFKYTNPLNVIRYIFLILMITFIILGTGGLLGIIDPYSIFGRIVVHLIKPIIILINNLLALFFEWTNYYYFQYIEIGIISLLSFIITIINFLIVVIFAFVKGRRYCNLFCPVGTLLGLLSKISLYKIRINKDKCNSCGLCEQTCKAECINAKKKYIDITRCVVCFNCIEKCNKESIKYSIKI